jgi:pimeloyl-ACP methyl ester carboxylesterase
MCATPRHVLVPTFTSLSQWSGESCAGHVSTPVLLITAGDGLPADMARTRELLPHLEIGRAVGVGHFAHAMAPDQINAMIAQFLVAARSLVMLPDSPD